MPKRRKAEEIHEYDATGVTTSKELKRNPAARTWIRRRNHCSLFMEPQMAEGQRASQGRRARRNTGRTQVHLPNMSLPFQSVLLSPLDNIWCFSFMTCIQTLAIKLWTRKHLEREKSISPSRRSGHTVTFQNPQRNYRSLGMAKHG